MSWPGGDDAFSFPQLSVWLEFHLKTLLHLTTVSFVVSFFYVCVRSQLDYNHISCIEDGAFRALRDLEVL